MAAMLLVQQYGVEARPGQGAGECRVGDHGPAEVPGRTGGQEFLKTGNGKWHARPVQVT